jgi:hypothetical protein
MNALTCAEVQEQLELLAAGACDPPMQAALEAHLRDCPACAASYAESRRLLDLLDLHWQHAPIERLRQRIDHAARPRRKQRLFTPFVPRAVAAAALVLIAVGLLWWQPQWHTNPIASESQLALLVRADTPRLRIDSQVPARATAKAEAPPVFPLAAPSGAALRRELLKAQRDGKLPLPPAVALELTLVNTGPRTVELRLGDVAPTLSLDVQGDGVLRIPAPAADPPSFLKNQTLQLKPKEQHMIRVDRLIAGSQGRLEYVYLTEPGEYTVTAQLRLSADGRGVVTVTGAPVRIMMAN